MRVKSFCERVDYHDSGFQARRYFSIICAAAAFAVAYVPGAKAQTFLGPTVSLASLTNSGGDVLAGDKDFSDFTFISASIPASGVTITPLEEPNGNFGIRISSAYFEASGSFADMVLGYQVSVTNSANLISAANLLFNGQVTSGTGLAEVVEQVFTNGTLYGQMDVFATATTNQLTASMPIVPPQQLLTINKDVQLTAMFPAFSTISYIDQSYTQVPEPSTLAMAVVGLAGLFLLRRRKH